MTNIDKVLNSYRQQRKDAAGIFYDSGNREEDRRLSRESWMTVDLFPGEEELQIIMENPDDEQVDTLAKEEQLRVMEDDEVAWQEKVIYGRTPKRVKK